MFTSGANTFIHFLFSFFKTGSGQVAQVGLELGIPLLQPPAQALSLTVFCSLLSQSFLVAGS